MGCCAARRPATWSPNPLGGYQQSGWWAWAPVVGDVQTSAGAVPGGACCDACASHQAAPAEGGCGCGGGAAAEPSGCASGACGLNQYTAGIKLPLSEYGVNAGAVASRASSSSRGSRSSGASMVAQADAWTAAAFGSRQAGAVVAVTPYSARFRRSTLPDLVALGEFELAQREADLSEMDFASSTPAAVIEEYRAELRLVRQEIQRREVDDPTEIGTADDVTAEDEADFTANRRQVAETTANNLEPGDDAASRARRDRIIAQSITGTLGAFNAYLEREYGARVANINAGRDITLLRLRNEDRQAEREYRLALQNARGNADSGGGGGGGGAAPVIGIGLIGLLWSVMK